MFLKEQKNESCLRKKIGDYQKMCHRIIIICLYGLVIAGLDFRSH